MRQPVVDTLQLCDALRKTGMEREQAEGVARALGRELGEHVVAQGDLHAGFLEVRADLGAKIQAVESKIEAVDSKVQALDSKIEAVQFGLSAKIGAVDSKLTFLGTILGLALALLAALTGIGVFQRPAPSLGDAAAASDAQPVSTVAPAQVSLPHGERSRSRPGSFRNR